jgi:hypothetical protein
MRDPIDSEGEFYVKEGVRGRENQGEATLKIIGVRPQLTELRFFQPPEPEFH